MRSLFSTLALVISLFISSCKSEADKKYEAAVEKTNEFITRWDGITKKTFKIEDWRAFRTELKALYLENKQLGIVKANLSEQQEKEIIKLYGKANAIHSRLALAKMQDDFTARGSNRYVEPADIDDEDIKLTY